MADVLPNYQVEMQRLRMQIAELRANMERQKLEIMEMEDRKSRLEENIQASINSIGEYEAQLVSLQETHGG